MTGRMTPPPPSPRKTLENALRERWVDWPDSKVRRKMWRERALSFIWFWGTPALVVLGLWNDWRFLFLVPFAVAFFACDAIAYNALRDELDDRKKVDR